MARAIATDCRSLVAAERSTLDGFRSVVTRGRHGVRESLKDARERVQVGEDDVGACVAALASGTVLRAV